MLDLKIFILGFSFVATTFILFSSLTRFTEGQNVFDQDEFAWHNVWTKGNECPKLPSHITGGGIGEVDEGNGRKHRFLWLPCWKKQPVTTVTKYGPVRGYTVPVEKDKRYINTFLGLPYAYPPVKNLRFQRPQRPPRFRDTWDATYYRHACPQPLEKLRFREVLGPFYNRTDEDCLYLNVFAPNYTEHVNAKYPVLVYIHGDNWITGVSQMQPGFHLAMKDVVVVTFDYRLGALGFLSTEDGNSPGNYGLWDQQMVLEWVKENIEWFGGDPRSVTLMGHGSGAASVGLHMLIPGSQGLFQQAIMLSGSDMSEFAVLEPALRPRDFAVLFAERMGCPFDDTAAMLNCLRKFRTDHELAEAAVYIPKKPGTNAGPFAPVVDKDLLDDMPRELRRQNFFPALPVMMGLVKDEGAWQVAEMNITDIDEGLTVRQMDRAVEELLLNLRVYDPDNVRQSVMFQYTYWPQPHNDTARRQMLVDLLSDLRYGNGSDAVMKSQLKRGSKVFSYVFAYRAQHEVLPDWMGCPHGLDVEFIFGYPFLNYTWQNETILKPRFLYTDFDRNISDFMMSAVANFTKQKRPSNPIEDMRRYNASWYHCNDYNHSYMYIKNDPEQKLYWLRYIQQQFENMELYKRQAIDYFIEWIRERYHLLQSYPSQLPQDVVKEYQNPYEKNYRDWYQPYIALWRTFLHRENWKWSYESFINYRQDKFAYWTARFHSLQFKEFYTTPLPTVAALTNYGIATWCLGGVALILLILVAALAITVCRRDKDRPADDAATVAEDLDVTSRGEGQTFMNGTFASISQAPSARLRDDEPDLFTQPPPYYSESRLFDDEDRYSRKRGASADHLSSHVSLDEYPYGTPI